MLESYIEKIESLLFEKAKNMDTPTIEEDLGALLFEATLYRYSKKEIYKERALMLLNTLTQVFGEKQMGSGFLEGFEGIFYVIQYLKKCDIIETEDIVEDLEKYLLQSLSTDFQTNNFDPIHGSIGKLWYYINSEDQDEKKVNHLIDQFLNALYNNRQENDKGIFWYDENEEEKGLVNLGMAHGLPGVLAFLLRLKELGFEHIHLTKLIEGVLQSLLGFKNDISKLSNFPDYHSENINQRNLNSRLGWCYGDLGITNTLLYASKVLEREDVKKEAVQILGTLIPRRMGTSGLDHFEDYSFFDTGFCHGLSGITFMLQKINNQLNNNPTIDKRIQFWKKELVHNLKIQLGIDEEIYLPWYRQDKEYTYTLDKASMLNGLCGTGLVLLSLQYNNYDWSDFFLLFE